MANSAPNSHSPRPMKASMRSLTSPVMSSSKGAIWRGANMGSSRRRYLTWSGGSTCSGMSGRFCPRSTASIADEKISGC